MEDTLDQPRTITTKTSEPTRPTGPNWEEVAAKVIAWIAYSGLFLAWLVPFLQGWQLVTGAMIGGHISGQLNKIIHKLTKINEDH